MVTSKIHGRGSRSRMLRIVAGRWRGRRWRFPESELRPTPDRVRETLFNWLQERVAGANCLDLFAGSGALGLEALSRGAASVAFVEIDATVAGAIRTVAREWGADNAVIEHCSAAQYLARPARPFDLVFLDPPFSGRLLEPSALLLDQRGWLANGALIYVEQARTEPPVTLPGRWQLQRNGIAGAVSYHLYLSANLPEPRP
jgi:16S rRNA (guanine966-N2)-methyltransferase